MRSHYTLLSDYYLKFLSNCSEVSNSFRKSHCYSLGLYLLALLTAKLNKKFAFHTIYGIKYIGEHFHTWVLKLGTSVSAVLFRGA